jgi:hypothetical protein
MCKFSSLQDTNYKKLRDRIKAEIKRRQNLELLGTEAPGMSAYGKLDNLKGDAPCMFWMLCEICRLIIYRSKRHTSKCYTINWYVHKPLPQAIYSKGLTLSRR